MENSVASASLIDHFSELGFRASVIATYSCYFPFYEEVLLRRMMSTGCTNNVLMVDSERCAEAYEHEETRPRRAGIDYTLIPVKVGGAFHPKVILRLGKSRGALIVGSHNVTLSGFGLNDEVTNIFRADGSSIQSRGAPFRAAFDYLEEFVPATLAGVVEAFDSLKQGIGWLNGPLGSDDPNRALLLMATSGATLWSQIIPLLPGRVSKALVCGPFFDPKLSFIRRLLDDVSPKQLTIGVDPDSVDLDPKQAAALDGVRFVNIAGITPVPNRREHARRYSHAKLLWFAGDDGELLVSGSANPSSAAFLATSARRNAEVVVADNRKGSRKALGIDALMAGPPITAADWSTVAARRAVRSDSSGEPVSRAYVATPTPTGFELNEPLPKGMTLRGVGEAGVCLGEAVVDSTDANKIEAPKELRDGSHFLKAVEPGPGVVVVVHRTEEIARRSGGDSARLLRQALGSLEEDPTQLEALLRVTEKVIFDSEVVPASVRASGATRPRTTGSSANTNASLALDAAGRGHGARRRSLASGDMVVLLDALIRRLGEGLETVGSGLHSPDEGQRGDDEEEGGELNRSVPDHVALAKACRSKARRLINRMRKQIERADAPGSASHVVVQLAAVLGVVRALRLIEQRPEWRKSNERLIAAEDSWLLFDSSVVELCSSNDALCRLALAEHDGEWFEEASMAMGLLAWLAWDSEVDVRNAAKRDGQQGVEDGEWYAADLLASIGPWLANDTPAQSILRDSVARTPRLNVAGDSWLSFHNRLLARVASVFASPDSYGKIGRRPIPGDLAILGNRFDPRIRAICNVTPSGSDWKIAVYDSDSDSGERAFMASRVPTLPWASASDDIALLA